jgi:hypothetical protein
MPLRIAHNLSCVKLKRQARHATPLETLSNGVCEKLLRCMGNRCAAPRRPPTAPERGRGASRVDSGTATSASGVGASAIGGDERRAVQEPGPLRFGRCLFLGAIAVLRSGSWQGFSGALVRVVNPVQTMLAYAAVWPAPRCFGRVHECRYVNTRIPPSLTGLYCLHRHQAPGTKDSCDRNGPADTSRLRKNIVVQRIRYVAGWPRWSTQRTE